MRALRKYIGLLCSEVLGRNGSSAKSYKVYIVCVWAARIATEGKPSWRWLAALSLAEVVEVADGRTPGHMNENICSPKSGDDIISFM